MSTRFVRYLCLGGGRTDDSQPSLQSSIAGIRVKLHPISCTPPPGEYPFALRGGEDLSNGSSIGGKGIQLSFSSNAQTPASVNVKRGMYRGVLRSSLEETCLDVSAEDLTERATLGGGFSLTTGAHQPPTTVTRMDHSLKLTSFIGSSTFGQTPQCSRTKPYRQVHSMELETPRALTWNVALIHLA